jgi:hypothetical protein
VPVLESTKTANLVERIDTALHDLCQPLTVLQCRLSMGEIVGEPEAMREAIREGLLEYFWLRAWLENGSTGKAGTLPATGEDVSDHVFTIRVRA